VDGKSGLGDVAGQPGAAHGREKLSAEIRRGRIVASVDAAAKSAIALAAAYLIGEGESLGLNVGTSVLAPASVIGERDDLRIFTQQSARRPAPRLFRQRRLHPGGKIRRAEYSVVGSGAVDQLHSHFLDRVFIGVIRHRQKRSLRLFAGGYRGEARADGQRRQRRCDM
jgi:DeoR/GlpR family transcriptional regulator of sugar metabolism